MEKVILCDMDDMMSVQPKSDLSAAIQGLNTPSNKKRTHGHYRECAFCYMAIGNCNRRCLWAGKIHPPGSTFF